MSLSSLPTTKAAPDDNAIQLSVGFILQPHFTLLAFAAFVDCLRLAADKGDFSRQIHIRWRVLGADKKPIKSSCGIETSPWETYDDPARFDYIVVVGGLLNHDSPPDATMLAFLRRAGAANVGLIGLCTGPFTLIQAGLMHGRRCCVSWYHYHDLIERYPKVTPVADQLFVVDGNRITCAGGMAAADLAAWLVERHCGRVWAQKSLRIMLIDHARRGSTSQPQQTLYDHVEDNRVRRAIHLIEQHLAEPLTSAKLAQQLNVSKRQLERAFHAELQMGPQQFARQLRLHYGMWLITHTNRSITAISAECGFADTAHFSRQFKAETGQTPSALRARHAPAKTSTGDFRLPDLDGDLFEYGTPDASRATDGR